MAVAIGYTFACLEFDLCETATKRNFEGFWNSGLVYT